jgi:hypothetical protein
MKTPSEIREEAELETSMVAIRALRDEALAAGDREQVALCDLALQPSGELDIFAPRESGRPWRDNPEVLAARVECARVIADAAMRACEDEP